MNDQIPPISAILFAFTVFKVKVADEADLQICRDAVAVFKARQKRAENAAALIGNSRIHSVEEHNVAEEWVAHWKCRIREVEACLDEYQAKGGR